MIKRARTCDHAALYFSGFDGPPRGVHFSGTQEAFEVISRLKIKGAFEPRDDQSAYGSHDITSLRFYDADGRQRVSVQTVGLSVVVVQCADAEYEADLADDGMLRAILAYEGSAQELLKPPAD